MEFALGLIFGNMTSRVYLEDVLTDTQNKSYLNVFGIIQTELQKIANRNDACQNNFVLLLTIPMGLLKQKLAL